MPTPHMLSVPRPRTARTALSALLLAQALAGGAGAAHAAETWSGATALCQAALPNYEGAIRKRPLALQNEGGASAFVTCNFVAPTWPTSVTVYVSSVDSVPKTLSCTAVSGTGLQGRYATRSATFAQASIEPAPLAWFPANFAVGGPRLPSRVFSLSCAVPPGAAINHMILVSE